MYEMKLTHVRNVEADGSMCKKEYQNNFYKLETYKFGSQEKYFMSYSIDEKECESPLFHLIVCDNNIYPAKNCCNEPLNVNIRFYDEFENTGDINLTQTLKIMEQFKHATETIKEIEKLLNEEKF